MCYAQFYLSVSFSDHIVQLTDDLCINDEHPPGGFLMSSSRTIKLIAEAKPHRTAMASSSMSGVVICAICQMACSSCL